MRLIKRINGDGPSSVSSMARTIGSIAILATVSLWLVSLSGCAVARDPSSGEVVLGIKAGQINDTAGQALSAAAGIFGGPGASALVSGALGLFGLGGTAAAAHAWGKEKGWDQNNAESPAPVAAAPIIVTMPAAAASPVVAATVPAVAPTVVPASPTA